VSLYSVSHPHTTDEFHLLFENRDILVRVFVTQIIVLHVFRNTGCLGNNLGREPRGFLYRRTWVRDMPDPMLFLTHAFAFPSLVIKSKLLLIYRPWILP
jgi:hypothetical protein